MAQANWVVSYHDAGGCGDPADSRVERRFETVVEAMCCYHSLEEWEEPRLEYCPLKEGDIPF